MKRNIFLIKVLDITIACKQKTTVFSLFFGKSNVFDSLLSANHGSRASRQHPEPQEQQALFLIGEEDDLPSVFARQVQKSQSMRQCVCEEEHSGGIDSSLRIRSKMNPN